MDGKRNQIVKKKLRILSVDDEPVIGQSIAFALESPHRQIVVAGDGKEALSLVDKQKFDVKQLAEMKQGCEPHCFSTLGYNVAYCYDAARVMKWLLKQASHGFQGVTGSFD